MRVLLIGSGGREHALTKALLASPRLTTLTVAPGNPGIALDAPTAQLTTLAEVQAWLATHPTDLVVIGPEAPLAAGWSDAIRTLGIPVFGASQSAARLESSKSFAKQVMQRVAVPTAAFRVFHDAAEASAFVRHSGQAWVVKADGLAAGKGVIVADSMSETLDAIAQLAALPAGEQILLEERLYGPEVSLIALSDGQTVLALPSARDHKRIFDGDEGPNTGGMGAIAPLNAITQSIAQQLAEIVMQPVIAMLAAHQTPFVGALYAGLMLTEHGPKVIEFNARFGDPETQVILPLCDGDVLLALYAAATQALTPDTLGWRAGVAACVVLSSAGYPDAPRSGDAITIDIAKIPANGTILHAGTRSVDGQLVTAGGRVLNAVGYGVDVVSALRTAYATVDAVRFAGMHYRLDIGQTELV